MTPRETGTRIDNEPTIDEASPADRGVKASISTIISTPSTTIEPLALRAPEAARSLGISTRQLWTLTNSGEVPHVRIGRTITYPLDALRAWLRKRSRGQR